MQFVNNWDLVDLSAPNIVGKFIIEKCTEFKEIK
jgi:3-methyladenine DNA glycosylase AlkD